MQPDVASTALTRSPASRAAPAIVLSPLLAWMEGAVPQQRLLRSISDNKYAPQHPERSSSKSFLICVTNTMSSLNGYAGVGSCATHMSREERELFLW